MENQTEDVVLKVRSYRRILAAALHLYKSKFMAMLKSQWLWLLITTILYTGVIMLTVYDAYFFIPAAIVAVLFEMVLWLMTTRWLSQRSVKNALRLVGHHWILLFFVAIGCLIILLPLSAIINLPAIILGLAEWNSEISVEMGDKLTMPKYVFYLALASWIITIALGATLRMLTVFVGYYAWGSAEAKKRKL